MTNNMMEFNGLAIGQRFDWVNPGKPTENSFFDKCEKISDREYKSLETGCIYKVGTIDAICFHVEPTISEKTRFGQRIEIPVHYNLWMQGARYGTIVGYRNGKDGQADHLLVRMDHKSVRNCLKLWRDDWFYAKRLGV